MHKFLRSVGHGLAGLRHVTASEANMRWHLMIAACVIVCGVLFRISLIEWALVVGCIGVVLALESMNTAIERLADRITEDNDPLIRQAKDAAAGGVLAMSMAAAVIGAIVFLPKLLVFMS